MPENSDHLALLVEANLFAFHADLGRSPLVELHQEGDVSWFRSGLAFHRLNRVLGGRFSLDAADTRIAQITRILTNHNLPAIWHLGPSHQPDNLGERLQAHGWELSSQEPGMLLDLSRLPPAGQMPAEFSIQRVQDEATLREWCQLTSQAFGDSQEGAQAAWIVEASLGSVLESARKYFIGRFDGQAVGTAALFYGAGVAGLYNVSVHPDFRRRGIARALTQAALQHARQQGWTTVTLHASPMGFGLYLQLGFQQVCTLERYRFNSIPAQ